MKYTLATVLNWHHRRTSNSITPCLLMAAALFILSVKAGADDYEIITSHGMTQDVNNARFGYYKFPSSYAKKVSNFPAYEFNETQSNTICLIQDWLFIQCPAERIAAARRYDPALDTNTQGAPRKEFESLISGTFPGFIRRFGKEVLMGQFFEFTFTDGSSTFARVVGALAGKVKSGSLNGSARIDAEDIASMEFYPDGALDVALQNGELIRMTKWKNVGIDAEYKLDRNKYQVSDELLLTVETQGRHGGVAVWLKKDCFGDRTLKVSRAAATNEQPFMIEGLVDGPLNVRLGKNVINEGNQNFLRGVRNWFLRAKCRVNGLPCRLLIEERSIKSFSIESVKHNAIAVSSLILINGEHTVELPNVTDVHFWKTSQGPYFYSVDNIKLKSEKLELSVPVKELAGISFDPRGRTAEMTLTNGEVHQGKVPIFYLNGDLSKEAYGGFPGVGTFSFARLASISRAE